MNFINVIIYNLLFVDYQAGHLLILLKKIIILRKYLRKICDFAFSLPESGRPITCGSGPATLVEHGSLEKLNYINV